jgi:hypothetical protein
MRLSDGMLAPLPVASIATKTSGLGVSYCAGRFHNAVYLNTIRQTAGEEERRLAISREINVTVQGGS